MRRQWRVAGLALCLALCLSLSVVYAGGEGEETAAAGDAGPVVLRIPVYSLGTGVASSQFEIVGDIYFQQNPDVDVEFIVTDHAGYADKITVLLAAGEQCDVVAPEGNPQYLNLINAGHATDLGPFVERDGIDLQELYLGLEDSLVYEDTLYAMPYMKTQWVIFYNKDMFDAAGVPYPRNGMTWNDYRDVMASMTSGSGADKVYGGFFMNWRSTMTNPAVSDTLHTVNEFDDYRWMIDDFEYIKSLQDNGYVMDYSTVTTNNIGFRSMFANHQCATVYQGTWSFQMFAAMDLDFEYGVVQAPYWPETGQRGNAVGNVHCALINDASDYKDEAWDFLKYLCVSEEGQSEVANAGGIPVLGNNLDVYRGFANVPGFPADGLAAFGYSTFVVETPMSPYASEVEEYLDEMYSLVMTDSMSIEEGIEQLADSLAQFRD